MATTTKTDNSTSAKPKISGSITVSARQRGNPILKSIRLAPWEFSDNIVPDYVINSKSAALYLSLKYHTLNPNYVHERLKTFTGFELRILLVQVDISEPHHALKQLMRICILSELTLILAWTWSHDEAGKILETYKTSESKPPDLIMEKSNPDPYSKLIDALTSVKSVNKTDAVTLLTTFGSLENIVKASIEDLTLCPGFGPQKAQRLHKVLHQTFKR
eukprot:07665.XXX_233233_232421_1 [CDS] Oithona nana genome sequencing.